MRRFFLSLALLAVMWASLSGCATKEPRTIYLNSPTLAEPSQGAWWQCRYRFAWDKKGAADLSKDLLVAVEGAAPVLETYEGSIYLWRFHRRAAPDAAGHQFSLLFYTTADVAEKLFADLRSVPLIQEMLARGELLEVVTDDIQNPTRTAISATSDAAWPEVIQTHWPVYIMGVSAFWLNMAQELSGETPGEESLDEKFLRFQGVHDGMTRLWRREGQHALLHHLSAIFGYERMWIGMPLRF